MQREIFPRSAAAPRIGGEQPTARRAAAPVAAARKSLRRGRMARLSPQAAPRRKKPKTAADVAALLDRAERKLDTAYAAADRRLADALARANARYPDEDDRRNDAHDAACLKYDAALAAAWKKYDAECAPAHARAAQLHAADADRSGDESPRRHVAVANRKPNRENCK